MTNQRLQDIRENVVSSLELGHPLQAIGLLKELVSSLSQWQLKERAERVEKNYRLMLQYLMAGVDDPERMEMYRTIKAEILSILDAALSASEEAESPRLYYSTLRTRRLRPSDPSITAMLATHRKLTDDLSLVMMLGTSDAPETRAKQKEMEKTQADIFMAVWTSQLLSQPDYEAISAALSAAHTPWEMRQHLASAITLGLMEYYDPRKLELLMQIYMDDTDLRPSSAALVGLLLGLWKHSCRQLPKQARDRLSALKEKDSWKSDLRVAFLELIRARDTERINRKMRDELIPKMERLRPDMLSKMQGIDFNPEDPASMQENPEWQDMLDKTGVSDQLKELMEIQMEGGDVMMSTFAHLKSFPFFNSLSNWFLPFDTRHSDVSDTVRSLDIVGEMMETARFLCDNDKYSFMLAINMVPSAQRELMVSQMKSQSDAIYQAMGDMSATTGPESRKMAVNTYVQNIYRFYKLYSRRNEFDDIFDHTINLVNVPAITDEFCDEELLRVVAEFYFKFHFYADALDVYKRIEAISTADAALYQKMGYCYERQSDTENATAYYLKAELLAQDNAWTVRRLAACYRRSGDNKTALLYYRKLVALLPDDLTAAMLCGQLLADNGLYDDALKLFYKVEFLDPNPTKARRQIGWLLLLKGDYEGASRQYEKIEEDQPTANDYLNMGHLAFAMGAIPEAVRRYRQAMQQTGGNKVWLQEAVKADTPSLKEAGIDTTWLPFIVEATD